MPYERIRKAKHVLVGTNQTIKALQEGRVAEVFLAEDADKRILNQIMQVCQEHGVTIEWVDSMKKLGEASGIQVKAAVAAILKA
jgi:large subunit ribosomal protein L7A